MPTVEVANIEVSANLARLDANMRAAESRVDRAAKRMQTSVVAVDRRFANMGRNTMGGRLGRMASSNIIAGAGLGGFGVGALGAGPVVAGAAGVGIGVGILKMESVFTNFDRSVNRLTSEIESGNLWGLGTVFDDLHRMRSGQPSHSAEQAELAAFKQMARMEQQVNFDLREANAVTDAERRIIEYERALAETQQWLDSVLKPGLSLTEQTRLMGIAQTRNRIAEIERDKKDKPEERFGFDTASTVFGQFKIAQRRFGGDMQSKSVDDTAKSTKATAENTKKLISLMEKLTSGLQGFA
jgi:hypothetical protein